jgi:hypothetical protein
MKRKIDVVKKVVELKELDGYHGLHVIHKWAVSLWRSSLTYLHLVDTHMFEILFNPTWIDNKEAKKSKKHQAVSDANVILPPLPGSLNELNGLTMNGEIPHSILALSKTILVAFGIPILSSLLSA